MSKKTKDPWVRIINVSDPVLHKKGYTLYKVTSKVFPKNSVEALSEVTVWKRYNDFKKLHKALHTIHQNLHLTGTFPTFAKARFFGRFDDSVIEERRLSALKLLQFANDYPPLFTSQIFVKFFEDGHSVEGFSISSESNVPTVDSASIIESSEPSNILQPKPYNSTERSPENGAKDCRTSLGGTWQHRQVADNISLSSHCTDDDEDDRTTFTDDDSSIYRPSFDLSEFDPLLTTNNINSSLNNPGSNINNVSDNWLLSALQSCSNQISEKEVDGILEFPTPFDDMEYAEVATPSNEYPYSAKSDSSSDVHFSFDLSSSFQNKSKIDEFDPLACKSSEVQDSEVSLYNCDDFASTPTALKNEKYQPTFILHASKYVISAQEAEIDNKYAEAFENYKRAIDVLLQGIKKNDHPDINDAVKKKILFYLMRAEEIYENKLPKAHTSNGRFKENPPFCENPSNKISTLQGCVQDLNKYKVLGILGKVLLVLDISNNTTYAVKTLYKSSIPKTFDVPHIVPQNIPFMIKLYHIYETSYAIFLILEHASGGRLWDYVSSYLQRSPWSPCNDSTCLYIEPKNKTDLSNVYSGKKISGSLAANDSNGIDSIDSDLRPSSNCPQSYVALFKKYAASMNKEANVSLAKYNKVTNVPCVNQDVNTNEESLSSSHNEDLFSTLQSNCDKEKEIASRSSKSHQKNSRNRLSSSTGSLETAISQKTCLLEAFNALDEAAFITSAKPTHLPESCVNMWAAEIIVALDALHNLGITWMDFHPDNILLGVEGHILLTYQSKWSNVDFFVKENAKENLFCAPEVGNVFPVTVDCDWWSLGALLFELLTGRSLVSCHPTGITMHTVLNFPSDISADAKDFVAKLLQFNPSERLGSGIYGTEELKSHPFFHSVDWESLYRT